MSNYNNLQDDDDSLEEVGFDMPTSDDKITIRLDDRFATNKQDKNKNTNEHRGRIQISMLDEDRSPTPSFDGFDVDSPLDPTANNNKNNNKNNDEEKYDINAQFIISANDNIEINNNQLTVETTKSKKKKKKKKKDKKKKKKYKTENTSIDMVSLTSSTNQIESNANKKANKKDTIGESGNQNTIVNEIDNNIKPKQNSKKKRKKKRKKKSVTRNDRIKAYVRTDVKWWLFVGTMLSIFICSYSAIIVGIAEDLVLFYRKYTDLICHYPTNDDSDGTKTDQKLIGDALTHKTIQQLFTSSCGAAIITFCGILISFFLIFCKKRGKSSRESNCVKIIYCIVFIICGLLLFVWNILLTMNVMQELHDLLNGLSHCEDENNDNEKHAKNEAQILLYEFEFLAVLILPMIFVITCTAWYIKTKTTF